MTRPHDSPSTSTPIVISQRTGWMLLAAVAAGFIVVAWAAPDATRILLGGIAIALFLSFPVALLDRLMPRRLAIAVTLLGMVVVGALAIAFVLPILADQLESAIDALPRLGDVAERALRWPLRELHERGVGPEPDKTVDLIQKKLTNRVEGSIDEILGGVVGGVSDAVGAIVQLVGMIFVAGYLLADAGRLKQAALAITPAAYRRDVDGLLDAIGRSLSRYLAALVASAAIQGTLATLALSLLGVPNALLLGTVTALTSVLPLVGIWLAAILAVTAALAVSPLAAGLAALVYVAIYFLDRRVIGPLLQSRALRVSPPITVLAVVAGGQIAGPLGAVLALPLVGVGRAVFDFLVERVRVVSSDPASAAAPAVPTAQGTFSRLAPLVNLTMSVVVVPHKAADVRSASHMALEVGDAKLTKQKNKLQLATGNKQ